MNDRIFGTINTYDLFKGYGFIRLKKGKDVFFHFTEINTSESKINCGDTVSFILQESNGRRRAKDVIKEG